MAIDDPIHDEGNLRGRAAVEFEFQQVADLMAGEPSIDGGQCVGSMVCVVVDDGGQV